VRGQGREGCPAIGTRRIQGEGKREVGRHPCHAPANLSPISRSGDFEGYCWRTQDRSFRGFKCRLVCISLILFCSTVFPNSRASPGYAPHAQDTTRHWHSRAAAPLEPLSRRLPAVDNAPQTPPFRGMRGDVDWHTKPSSHHRRPPPGADTDRKAAAHLHRCGSHQSALRMTGAWQSGQGTLYCLLCKCSQGVALLLWQHSS